MDVTTVLILEDWSLMEPLGFYKALYPKKVACKINGESTEIIMNSFKAVDPVKDILRLEDGRIVKFGAPSAEYLATFPNCLEMVMEDANKYLPHEDIQP
jgi:hypothetical protein